MSLPRATFTLLATLGLALGLTACGTSRGFTPLYQNTGNPATEVGIRQVVVTNPGREVGERRAAQIVGQELNRFYAAGAGTAYTLDIALTESWETLALRRDATDERFELRLLGRVSFYDPHGRLQHTAVATTRAPYNVQTSPYATETARQNARETAARALAQEIQRRVLLFLGDGRR